MRKTYWKVGLRNFVVITRWWWHLGAETCSSCMSCVCCIWECIWWI